VAGAIVSGPVVSGFVPAVLLAQGGGHNHVLDIGVNIGPVVLRIALLVVIPAVAGFALLRGFLAEPGRRDLAAVVGCAGGGVVLELMLSGGLTMSERVVPLLLALLAVPLYLVLSRDPRFVPAVGWVRRCAPWVFWPLGILAAERFARAWLAGGGTARTETLLHTGVVLALVAMAWFAVSRPRRAGVGIGVQLGAVALAMALIVGAGQVTVPRDTAAVPGAASVAPQR
jgi:Family of unknown function (DUF6239)